MENTGRFPMHDRYCNYNNKILICFKKAKEKSIIWLGWHTARVIPIFREAFQVLCLNKKQLSACFMSPLPNN